MKDKELSLACYKVYNDWMAEFQALRPRSASSATPRFPPPASTTASRSCTACADMGLRTVQLEAYPSGTLQRADRRRTTGSGPRRSSSTCRSTSTSQFFFPAGDLGSNLTAEGVPEREKRAKKLGIDIAAGEFTGDPVQHDHVGRVRALPGPEVHRDRELRGLGAVLPGALRRVGDAQPQGLERCRCCRASTSTATCWSCTSSTRSVSAERYDVGIAQHHVGSRLPALDEQLAGRLRARAAKFLERAGATPSEIERIMWRNAADLYKLPYDEPERLNAAA